MKALVISIRRIQVLHEFLVFDAPVDAGTNNVILRHSNLLSHIVAQKIAMSSHLTRALLVTGIGR